MHYGYFKKKISKKNFENELGKMGSNKLLLYPVILPEALRFYNTFVVFSQHFRGIFATAPGPYHRSGSLSSVAILPQGTNPQGCVKATLADRGEVC